LRSFLGIINFIGKYLNGIVPHITILNNLLRTKQKTTVFWNPEATNSFKASIRKGKEPLMLSNPCYDKAFIVLCDGSNESVWGVVSQFVDEQAQEDNDQKNSKSDLHEKSRPIVCFLTVCTRAQKNYTTTEKEISPIVTALRLHKNMLLSSQWKTIF
jgi:RNase H-like domain found in reverse transcriptase